MSDNREQRNQVFTGQAPVLQPVVQPGMPTMTAADKVKADFGVDIPVEMVPLPSGGKVYPNEHPFHLVETVEITPMTAREEDILTSRALMKKGTIITELIKSCLADKRVNPVDLITGDRHALMVAIRITGYGAEYDVEVECNECNTKAPRQFNLAELPVRRLELDPVAPGLNLFEFLLPYTKKSVRFKFLTGRDEEVIMATADKQKKLGLQQAETNVTTNLLYSIQSVDGVEDRAKIANFVKLMPARDSLALRNFIRDNEPGILMRQEAECPSCGASEVQNIPILTAFLWPGAGR